MFSHSTNTDAANLQSATSTSAIIITFFWVFFCIYLIILSIMCASSWYHVVMNCDSSKPISFDYGTSECEMRKKVEPMFYIVSTKHNNKKKGFSFFNSGVVVCLCHWVQATHRCMPNQQSVLNIMRYTIARDMCLLLSLVDVSFQWRYTSSAHIYKHCTISIYSFSIHLISNKKMLHFK